MPVIKQKEFPIEGTTYHCEQLPATKGIKLMHRCLKLIADAGEAIAPAFKDKESVATIKQAMQGSIVLDKELIQAVTENKKAHRLAGMRGPIETVYSSLVSAVGQEKADQIIKAHQEKETATDDDSFYAMVPMITNSLAELFERVDEDFLVKLLKDLVENSVITYSDEKRDLVSLVNDKGVSEFESHFPASRIHILLELAARLMVWNFEKPIEALKKRGAGGKVVDLILATWGTAETRKAG